MSAYVELEKFASAVHCILRSIILAQIEADTAMLLLTTRLKIPQEEIDVARALAKKSYRPLLDKIDQSTVDQLLDLLRKFEGPVQ